MLSFLIYFISYFLCFSGVVWSQAQSCDSCGSECKLACGTKHFRSCCFNYIKKRTSNPPLPIAMDPALRLELKLAKFRHPSFHQKSLLEDYFDIPSDENEMQNQPPMNN